MAKEDQPVVSQSFRTLRLCPVIILLEFTVIARISNGIRIGTRCQSRPQLIWEGICVVLLNPAVYPDFMGQMIDQIWY